MNGFSTIRQLFYSQVWYECMCEKEREREGERSMYHPIDDDAALEKINLQILDDRVQISKDDYRVRTFKKNIDVYVCMSEREKYRFG